MSGNIATSNIATSLQLLDKLYLFVLFYLESKYPKVGNCLCGDVHVPGYNFVSLNLIDQIITLKGLYHSYKNVLVLVRWRGEGFLLKNILHILSN